MTKSSSLYHLKESEVFYKPYCYYCLHFVENIYIYFLK